MTISELGSLGELLAAIATLLTLIYLALQIRQTTRSLELNRTKVVQDDADRWRSYLIENKEIAALYRRGMTDSESLDSDDRLRFRMLMDQLLYGWQTQYFSQADAYTATREFWPQTLQSPGGGLHWQRSRQRFEPEFVNYIESLSEAKQ